MREIRTSGLMSGDGKRSAAAAPVLDSTRVQVHRGSESAKLLLRQRLIAEQRGVSRNWGITPSLPVVGLGWRPAQTGGRAPNQARRCRSDSEPGAEGQRLFATIASAAICSFVD